MSMRRLAATRAFAAVLFTAMSMPASGPYTPVRVAPQQQRDDLYDIGKALFLGDVRIGSGTSCAGCHNRNEALSRKRLQGVKFQLESKINDCVQFPDRINGTADSKQKEALAYYLAKRYGI